MLRIKAWFNLTENTQIACPVCDYERGSRGKPVMRGENMTCLSCGTTWKELGAPQLAVESSRKGGQKTPGTAVLDSRVFNKRHFSETPSLHEGFSGVPSSDRSFFHFTAYFAGLLLLGVLGFATLHFGGLQQDNIDRMITASIPDLQVSNIRLEKKIRPDGRAVAIVRGSLENKSDKVKPVPRIAIVLRQANGLEAMRWYHNSPIRLMKPGQRRGFVSLMPIGSAHATYAEAVFEGRR